MSSQTDVEMERQGLFCQDGFHESPVEVQRSEDTQGAHAHDSSDPIIKLICPRSTPKRKESVKTTFHGRRGSVVALEVLHGNNNSRDNMNMPDVNLFLSDPQDLPNGMEKRQGKGMVPSASCSQLHDQLGFERTVSVSESLEHSVTPLI